MQICDKIKDKTLRDWLQNLADLMEPDDIHLCCGSQEEYNSLCELGVKTGMFIKTSFPDNSYQTRSAPNDVARVEQRTFICSEKEEDAGPTNHWKDPKEMKAEFQKLCKGCMHGRVMYIIPFCMGPLGSPIAKYGIEITDSIYVVVNMMLITRVATEVIDRINNGQEFVKCLHSVGVPLEDGDADVPWPCTPVDQKYITQFPETREIISFGSGYGGNALLGKKCFALRIATVLARDEGWMAEHMLILKLTSPEGEVKYVGGAFPSACGKTNLAMLEPTLPGWTVQTVGDDIAWMKFGKDGRLYAINPENGFFGVAPGTSMKSNPNAMRTINAGNAIFTNTALTLDGKAWWEDGDEPADDLMVDWQRRLWRKGCGKKASNPNARFTVPASQCPVIAPEWEKPEGVPISAFLFGGRRKTVVPLVNEATSWEQGVFMGSTMASEMTAATLGGAGQLRFDPFAMLPFCGYNMGDYFQHWLDIGKKEGAKLPKIFYVNWFRRSPEGKFLWPGFGDNSRVLKWVFECCNGTAKVQETAIGNLPTKDALDLSGLDLSDKDLEQLLSVDKEGWKAVMPQIEAHYAKFGDKLPKELVKQFEDLKARLNK